MKTITRKLVIDAKGTLAPFKFIEFTIGDRSIFVNENLLVDNQIPAAELKALSEFLSSEEVQDDLMFLPITTVVVNRLHTISENYSSRFFKEDFWIK